MPAKLNQEKPAGKRARRRRATPAPAALRDSRSDLLSHECGVPSGSERRIHAAVKEAAGRIRSLSSLRPTLAIVLGSGFHHVLTELEVDGRASYADLPGFATPGVAGHTGELLIGRLQGTPVMVFSGRAHFYEGHPLAVVTFGVRVAAACGITDLLLTNAAGGISRRLTPGTFMLLTDHINLMGSNPLRGGPWPGTDRFVDLTHAYDPHLTGLLRRAARACGARLQPGIYLAVSGPSYETPAEIRAFARLGASAVGMSTVPEVIVARQCGLRVAALSCITNAAAGTGTSLLSHSEVLQTAERVKTAAARLLAKFAQLYEPR